VGTQDIYIYFLQRTVARDGRGIGGFHHEDFFPLALADFSSEFHKYRFLIIVIVPSRYRAVSALNITILPT